MHEQGIAEDLVARAADVVAGGGGAPVVLRLRIGALAGVTREGLTAALSDKALARWGRVPRLVIDISHDIHHVDATGVVLSSVTVEG